MLSSGLRDSHEEVGMNKFFLLSTFVWKIQVLLKAKCHHLKQNYRNQKTCCLVSTHLEMSFVAVVTKMTSWRKLVLLQGMLREARNFVVENLENSITMNIEQIKPRAAQHQTDIR